MVDTDSDVVLLCVQVADLRGLVFKRTCEHRECYCSRVGRELRGEITVTHFVTCAIPRRQ